MLAAVAVTGPALPALTTNVLQIEQRTTNNQQLLSLQLLSVAQGQFPVLLYQFKELHAFQWAGIGLV
jgi:hypothetical protein